MFYDQADYAVRCEWGLRGVEALAPASDVVVIVDVLSFSTCVEIATARGAVIFPYVWRDATAAAYAQDKQASWPVPDRGLRRAIRSLPRRC